MDRLQFTPELLERAEWFCEFGLLVVEIWKAHPTWTQNELAQEIARLTGASYDEMRYWVGLVFEAVARWERIQQERGRKWN